MCVCVCVCVCVRRTPCVRVYMCICVYDDSQCNITNYTHLLL